MHTVRLASLLALLALLSCGCTSVRPVSQKTAPPKPAPALVATPEARAPKTDSALSAEEAAKRFCQAMLSGDKQGMKNVTLTHAELASISKKAPSAEDYATELEDFLESRVKESKDAPPGTRLERVEVEKSEVLKAAESEKLIHDLAYAIVHPVFVHDGESRQGMGLLFVKTDSGFKLSIRN